MVKLMGTLLATLVLATLAGTAAEADMRARTTDGKDVLLKDNGTWKYVKRQGRSDKAILIRIVKYQGSSPGYCYFSFELKNNTGENINFMSVQFGGYDDKGSLGEVSSIWKKLRKGKSRINKNIANENILIHIN